MLNLATMLANHRWASKQTLREFGAELDIPASTLMRIEQGYESDGSTVAKIMRWLFSDNGEGAKRAPSHQKRMKVKK